MAERIVSPGVFTREQDLSFLPQGIAEIGAAIIGPFEKGPAFVPTVIESQNKATQIFGDDGFYTPFTVQNYLKSSGRVTIVRVLGSEGYTANFYPIFEFMSESNTDSGSLLAVLSDTKEQTNLGGQAYSLTGSVVSGSASDFIIDTVVSGAFSASFQVANTNYITKVFGTDPRGSKPFYVYANFPFAQSQSVAGTVTLVSTGSVEALTFDAYNSSSTTEIQSQLVGGTQYDMFKIAARSDGTSANQEVKVGIIDVKFANEIQGSLYGTFGIVVRKFSDTDKRNEVLESFNNLTLDPKSPRFLPKAIGDQFATVLTTAAGLKKMQIQGDWPNKSDYIRIDLSNDFPTLPFEAVPFGFRAYFNPVAAIDATGSFTSGSLTTRLGNGYKIDQLIDSETNSKAFFGLDFDNNGDIAGYMAPLQASATTGSNADFVLSNHVGANTGSLTQRKFILGFQDGFNGQDPTNLIAKDSAIVAGNSQGFDLSGTTASGTVAYRQALDLVANPDEFDINLLAVPGVLHSLHPTVTNHAITKVEDRGDAFYIMDPDTLAATIPGVVTTVEALDSNYTGVYYPWIRILHPTTQLPIWVPPSVVLPGVFAFSDQVSQEWFAPAGLNRGGLTEAISAYTRLTFSERDTLYEGKVNPIATFPGQGIVVWGQKTLQAKASALDRINVRRLLIALKKFIASTSNFLVFEQNVASTRNRFLNVVNPFLESVQQRSGLFAFKVVMDESNNPPDIIDRNQLVGQIFLQPARASEFITLDFNILPTGATFG